MKAILDTNVVISGIFFGGHPRKIIEYAQQRIFTNVISHDILDEYTAVVNRIAALYQNLNASKILDSIIAASELTFSIVPKEPVCKDPHDDKFLSAALAAKVQTIVSGDTHLKAVSGWAGITVVSPDVFFKMLEKIRKYPL